MATWADEDDVRTITGVDVSLDSSLLSRAEAIVAMHAGITTSATVYTRDEEWLQQAVVWQAAWLYAQSGVEARAGVGNVQQEGLSVTYQDEASIVLAPLARRALKNLSWIGSRSVRLAPPRPSVDEIRIKTTSQDPPDQWWEEFHGDGD